LVITRYGLLRPLAWRLRLVTAGLAPELPHHLVFLPPQNTPQQGRPHETMGQRVEDRLPGHNTQQVQTF